ncbi:glycine oxidase ThiO [Pseudoteredinibacter isoporae]|uniref:Glycine oxidase n=1 Tax=Pseudoteredinibacter isoporae TaxID=570281 RepID=A0A7X0JVS5_9GAMM|nr:glycine oxidase ThiO [Pseudoteredinibacter isoporae]MBB6523175.1 glycine oxidase [Pseudoteredinibacter isoporae]NHO88693.1 glycine oxidase ThiO [Pseudoteredinibacter isoporae]NIB22616.1 glycine oxidase ThiO [Pseudoteredinibacter isoporae]
MSKSSQEIAIVGAGIMGRCLAWRLSDAGHKITLFDQDAPDHGNAAAYTAAGMLAPYSELEAAEDSIFQLGQYSLELWANWLKAWQAEDCWQTTGTLVVAHRQDQASLERFNRQLRAKLFSRTNDAESVHYLKKTHIAEIEPELTQQFEQATFLSGEAWLDNHRLMAVMAEKLQAVGIEWRSQCKVHTIDSRTLSSDSGEEDFDHIFDCRGMGAKALLSDLRAVRGEVIRVHANEVELKHMVRLMHPRYRLYLVPKPNREYVLGATQIETEDYSPMSVRSALELLSALYAIHPGFAEARIVESLSNCRPALPDNQPIIRVQDGLTEINGLFRHGFLLAPALADICARHWLEEDQAKSDIDPLINNILRIAAS